MFEVVKEHCVSPQRIVMKTGTLCHWLVRELASRGLDVELYQRRDLLTLEVCKSVLF